MDTWVILHLIGGSEMRRRRRRREEAFSE